MMLTGEHSCSHQQALTESCVRADRLVDDVTEQAKPKLCGTLLSSGEDATDATLAVTS